jgi:transcriptional regulator NrdR family protein
MILETRHNLRDAIRRRKECNECGHRFTTYETTIDPTTLHSMATHATSYLVGDSRMRTLLRDLQALINEYEPPTPQEAT